MVTDIKVANVLGSVKENDNAAKKYNVYHGIFGIDYAHTQYVIGQNNIMCV